MRIRSPEMARRWQSIVERVACAHHRTDLSRMLNIRRKERESQSWNGSNPFIMNPLKYVGNLFFYSLVRDCDFV